ncbi:MAG: hypothetical protein N4A31_03625 [Rickettsiales bacterium]|jgi:hypothetical protein|nr:hypothetical protein [Rickettsiales bacterium]
MSETIKKKSSRSRIDYSEKLKKLEEEKQQLILQRKEEIFSIIEKTNCLSIDNELLAGAFAVIKEIDGKQTEELSDNLKAFELLMREKAPAFFRRKYRVRKS